MADMYGDTHAPPNRLSRLYYHRISPALEFIAVYVAATAYLALMDTLSGAEAAVVTTIVVAGVAWRLR